MRVEYGSETLGDDAAGDFIIDDGGTHQRVVQQTPLLGGSEPFIAARGNNSNTRGFTISKEHATLAEAKAWFNRHPDTLPGSGGLWITEGTDIDLMTNAVLVSVERVSLTGKSTTLRYTFTGGQIAQTA